jgi:hypothetical protein
MSSHLESFIRGDQNSSVERVAQMKDSLHVMDGRDAATRSRTICS